MNKYLLTLTCILTFNGSYIFANDDIVSASITTPEITAPTPVKKIAPRKSAYDRMISLICGSAQVLGGSAALGSALLPAFDHHWKFGNYKMLALVLGATIANTAFIGHGSKKIYDNLDPQLSQEARLATTVGATGALVFPGIYAYQYGPALVRTVEVEKIVHAPAPQQPVQQAAVPNRGPEINDLNALINFAQAVAQQVPGVIQDFLHEINNIDNRNQVRH